MVNRGSLCPWCRKKICKNCRKPVTNSSWICTMCFKEREIKAESGAWFYDNLPKKKKVQYGSSLLKKFVRRRKSIKYSLSKSRRISEDELVTSGEIEYTVERTFRSKSLDPKDHEYIVVDQGTDGDISISEGKVACNISYESEAAALDTVHEGDEKEAAFRDVATNSTVLNDTCNQNGMDEYLAENVTNIEAGNNAVGTEDAIVSIEDEGYDKEVLNNDSTEWHEDRHTSADSTIVVDSYGYDSNEALKDNSTERHEDRDSPEDSCLENRIEKQDSLMNVEEDAELDKSSAAEWPDDSTMTDESMEESLNRKQSVPEEENRTEVDIEFGSVASTYFFLQKSQSAEIKQEAMLDDSEQRLDDNEVAGMEAKSELTTEERLEDHAVVTSLIDVQKLDEESIPATLKTFDDQSDESSNEEEQIENNFEVEEMNKEDNDIDTSLKCAEAESSKFVEIYAKQKERGEEEEILDVQLTKQFETEVNVSTDDKETDYLISEKKVQENNATVESTAQVIINNDEVNESVKDSDISDQHGIESKVLEIETRINDSDVNFEKNGGMTIVIGSKPDWMPHLELTNQIEMQQCNDQGTDIDDACLEDTSLQSASSQSMANHDDLKEQSPIVKDVIATYEEREVDNKDTSSKKYSEDKTFICNLASDVNASTDSEKEIKSFEREMKCFEKEIKSSEEEVQSSTKEENYSEQDIWSSKKEVESSEKEEKAGIVLNLTLSHEKAPGLDAESCQIDTPLLTGTPNAYEEVSFNQNTGKVNGYKKAHEEYQASEDIDDIFEEYIQKEKAGKPDISGSYESLDSNRSDDVYEAQRPQVKVTGEILLGLKYETISQHFEIQVHKAKGLVAVDTRKNSSDPYVKTYLLQDKTRSNKKKTKVKKHTLEPIFDEILSHKIGYEELLQKVLSVSVWHNDLLGQNVFLGEVHISVTDYIASGYSLEDPVPHMYQLSERQQKQSTLKHVGELSLEIMYAPPGATSQMQQRSSDPVSGQLIVKCVEGKDLEGNENTSPFCKLLVLPVKNKAKDPKHKTSVESRTLNPYWDQDFIFDNVTFHDLSSKVLQVSVHNASAGNKKNFLGAVRLGLGASDKEFDDSNENECMAWQRMLQEPNKRISVTLGLRSTIESLKSSASLPPVLVERIQEVREHVSVRDKKSDSVLSSISAHSLTDASSLKGASLKPKFKAQPDQYSLQSYGSLMSVYSDAGGYGSIPVTGEMLFSIQYDDIAGVFEVRINKAKNIAAANKKTRNSDPYVKTYLLPDKSKESKKKTNFRKKTINPDWNETIKYKIGQKDLMKRTLQVSIWNNEKFGHNDFLGEVQVQIAQYVKSGHSLDNHEPIWYTLQEMAPISVSGPGYQGILTIGLKFEAIEGEIGKLLVEIKEAKDLAAADVKSLSNPFVKSYLLPDRTRKSKRKSTFKKATLSPKWNEKFEYNGVTLAELEQRVLELTVWDHEPHSNDFLGGTRVGLGRGDQHWHDCIGKEISVWNAMLEHPGIWVEYSVPLRDSMTSRKGMALSPPDVDIVKPVEVPIMEPRDSKQGERMDPLEPMLRVGLMFVAQENGDDKKKRKGQLKVNLRGARNLPVRSEGVSPSTYCKCFLLPRKSTWKFKTDLFKRSSEPLWEKEFIFKDISLDELSSKCLDVVIFDDNNVSLGMARLGMGIMQEPWDDSTGREIEIWNAMIDNPDEWNNLMIPLRLNTSIPSEDPSDVEESKIEVPVEDKGPGVQDEEPDSKGTPTAKELALKSMGNEAAKVVDIIKKSEPENEQKKKTFSKSQDHLDRNFRPLSLVREELEETGVEEPSHVRFATNEKTISENITEKTPVITSKPEKTIPKVVISTNDETLPEVQPTAHEEISFEEDEVPFRASNTNLSKMSKFGSRDSLTSMTSVYSGIAPIYGSVPIKGQIQFAMKYVAVTNIFEVHIFKAKDIAAVDAKKEVSDPYVKIYLLPDKTKGSKRKTKVKHKTINPVWDEIIDYKMSIPNLRNRILLVSVWNYDRFGRNIFLGEVIVHMEEQLAGDKLDQVNAIWYDLQEKSQIHSPILYKGELTISLMFEDIAGNRNKTEKKSNEAKLKKKVKDRPSRICIHVIKAEDLPAGDGNGLCDPYCKFYLLPLKQAKTKRKTPVIKKTRSAQWDFKAEYDVDFDDLPELGIEFSIYDWDKHSRNDFLGCARLNLGGQNGKWDDAVGIEREAWQTMIKEPNKWHEFVIPLRSSSDPRPRMDYE